MRTFLVVLSLVGFMACGTATPKCSSSTCSGCCDASGQCASGGSNSACGAGGAQCQPCANSQACTFGQCVTQNTSGGGAGGGTGGGSVGGGTGGAMGGGTGGGTGGGVASCSPVNCAGCCDLSGICQGGTSSATCGVAGSSCQSCGAGTCNQGTCVGGSGGGGGATGGGAGGGGGSFCSTSTCPSGCCTAAGVCITITTPSRCGSGGNQCTSCQMGNTCVSGACQPCAGCIDINTGQCRTGSSNTECGRNGGFCQACDSSAGQTCQSGVCSGGTTCNSSSCSGCCDGNTCVAPTQFTNAQCGQGLAGAACVTCLGGAICDSSSRQCTSGPVGGGGGSGLDAGFGCLDSSECPGTQCCDSLGASIPGACIAASTTCQFGGANFSLCLFLGSCTCNGATKTCQ